MTLRQLYEALEQRLPGELSCPWDNDGVMLCMDWDRPVKRVLTCLDVSESCVNRACQMGADLILSHHPMIFHPLKRLDCQDAAFRLPAVLMESKISVFSFHTRLDAVEGGLNDRLAQSIGMKELCCGEGEEGSLIRIGRVEECSPSDFAARVSKALNVPLRCWEGNHSVKRVMSVCGGGKDFLPLAQSLGVDAFVSGDLSYNGVLDAVFQGLTVIDATHRGTEIAACGLLRDLVLEICPEMTVEEHPFGGEERVFLP